ncbi:MAG: M56 family metallopeptidase, partial [Planctomycetota bacterium]
MFVEVPNGWKLPGDAAELRASSAASVRSQGDEGGSSSSEVVVIARDTAATDTVPKVKNLSDSTKEASGTSQEPLIASIAPVISITYCFGVAVFLVRLATSLRGGHRLNRISQAVADPDLLAQVAEQAKRIGLRFVPAVAYCQRIAVPTVVGVMKPVVLVPASLMSGLTPDQFAAVIAHELAHIRRHDLLLNLGQRLVEALLFFHPITWYISRQMSAQREMCCDDLVVRSGYSRMKYADALLQLAEKCAFQQARAQMAVAATGNNASQLELRIRRLMEMSNTTEIRVTRWSVVLFGMLIFSVAMLPAAVHRFANADEPVLQESAGDLFTDRLAELHTQAAVQVGRDNLVEKYEALIREFPDHPERGTAMFRLAHIWENTIPEQNAKPHPELTIKWLRRAYHAAKPGSEVWVDAGLNLNNRIYRDSPDEAKAILNSILASKPDVVNELIVWNARQSLAIHRNDWNEAERIGRMMLDWCRSEKCPKTGLVRTRFFREVRSGARTLISHWSAEGHTKKIEALLEDYPFQFVLEEYDLLGRRGFADVDIGISSPQGRFRNQWPGGSGSSDSEDNWETPEPVDTRSQDRGLDFLDAFPRFDEFSLEMTEAEFKEITRREQLDFSRSEDGASYYIPTGDGHTLIVMFGNNGRKCSGLQLVRGESKKSKPPWRGDEAKARAMRKRPSFGEIQHGLNVGLAIHEPRKRFAKGDWVVWECYLQNAGEVERSVQYWPATVEGRVMTVTDVKGRPVNLPGYIVTFEQDPIRITLQPNEIYVFLQGFQLGEREDGRMAGPTWINPQPGEYQVQCDLNVTVSGHDPGDEDSDANLKSGKVGFRFVEPKQANQNGVTDTFVAYRSRNALLDLDTNKVMGPMAS